MFPTRGYWKKDEKKETRNYSNLISNFHRFEVQRLITLNSMKKLIHNKVVLKSGRKFNLSTALPENEEKNSFHRTHTRELRAFM